MRLNLVLAENSLLLGNDMTHLDELWRAIRRVLQTSRWTRLPDIYAAVESFVVLDAEDYEPEAPGSFQPKWKRNVRNVLQSRKSRGDVQWDKTSASYKL